MPANYAMVESINHIGHVMGRKTIAEFVENAETLQTLNKLGIDYMQGFGIAKPSALANLENNPNRKPGPGSGLKTWMVQSRSWVRPS